MRMLIAIVMSLLTATMACAAQPEAFDCNRMETTTQQLKCITDEIHATRASELAEKQKAWSELCRRRGDIRVRLDYEGVKKSCWGTRKPLRINTTVTGAHKHEQWVYGNSYLYFTDGIVTGYQQSSRP